jgi:xanthine dehydrogenase accessory factor
MRAILTDLERWQREGEEIALATLVRVHRSAPRRPGARMAVTRGGRMTGSVSGGCVESDVAERAMLMLDDGRPMIARYGISDEDGFAVGLACGGAIDVLIEPFAADAPWEALRAALDGRVPAALCIALAPEALLGRRMLVRGLPGAAAASAATAGANGTTRTDARAEADASARGSAGAVGSIHPELDDALADAARAALLAGGTREVTLPRRDGEATVFLEAFPPQARLFIVGATHTAMPLSRMARELGFGVSVVDPRGVYATPERFPEVELLHSWPDAALAGAGLDPWSYVVTLTHDPKLDIPTLAVALRSPARYVGAMSSRRTHEARKTRLRELGFGEDDLRRIRAPIGLDLGGRTPEEIALAILAEILAVRYGRSAGVLRDREASIHGDDGRR